MASKEKTLREIVLSILQTNEEVIRPFIERTDKAIKGISEKDYLTVPEAKEMFATKDEVKLPVMVAKVLIFAGGAAIMAGMAVVVKFLLSGGLKP